MNWILLTIFLCMCAVMDFRSKVVSVNLCIINIIVAVILNIILKNNSLVSLSIGITVVFILFVTSKLSREKFGMGDVYVLLVSALYVGLNVIDILLIALFLSLIFSVGLLVKKKNIKVEFPFVPFILGGEIGVWIMKMLGA